MLGQETGAAFSLKLVGCAARCSHFSSRLVMSSMMSGLLDFLMMALMACLSAVLVGVVRSSALVLSRGRIGHFQGVLFLAWGGVAFLLSTVSVWASSGCWSARCRRGAAPPMSGK